MIYDILIAEDDPPEALREQAERAEANANACVGEMRHWRYMASALRTQALKLERA